MSNGLSAPPPNPPPSQAGGANQIPTAPNDNAPDRSIPAHTAALNQSRTILLWRAWAGLVVGLFGLAVIGFTLYKGYGAVTDAWLERKEFKKDGLDERLKYVIAFLSFKAVALGGALTAGLLLVRAANKLSGGTDETSSNSANLSIGD
jgi:hypothetical protein